MRVNAPSTMSMSAACNGSYRKVVTEQENPSPGRVIGNTIHLTNGSGEQTTESTGQRSGGKEESVTFLDLITLVPPIGRSRSEV